MVWIRCDYADMPFEPNFESNNEANRPKATARLRLNRVYSVDWL